MKTQAEIVIVIERPAHRLYLGRALSGTEDVFVRCELEAECTYDETTEKLVVQSPRIVSHDGPEDFSIVWADFDRIQVKQAIRSLNDAHIEAEHAALPYAVELAS